MIGVLVQLLHIVVHVFVCRPTIFTTIIDHKLLDFGHTCGVADIKLVENPVLGHPCSKSSFRKHCLSENGEAAFIKSLKNENMLVFSTIPPDRDLSTELEIG